MKKIKNIWILGLLIISLLNIDTVHAGQEDEELYVFYTTTECKYVRESDKEKIILRRDFKNGDVINSFTVLKSDNTVKEAEKTQSSNEKGTFTERMYPYSRSTVCPKYVSISNGYLVAQSKKGSNYVLNESKNLGENVYWKLPTCLYRTSNPTLKSKTEYGMKVEPKFEIETFGEQQIIKVRYYVTLEKPYADGDNIGWKDFKSSTAIYYTFIDTSEIYTCPDYAHYNDADGEWAPVSKHLFALTNDTNAPKDFGGEHILLPRYIDFSNVFPEMDRIYKNYTDVKAAVDKQFSSWFSSGGNIEINNNTCEHLNLRDTGLSFDEMKRVIQEKNDLMLMTHRNTLGALRNVKVDKSYTLGDLDDGKVKESLALYKSVTDYYGKMADDLSKLNTAIKEMMDCLYSKLINSTNITEEQRQELETLQQDSAQKWDQSIDALNKIKLNFNIDYADYDCKALLSPKLIKWLDTAYLVIEIGAGIAVVVLGMLDFSKAVVSAEDNAMKKAWQSFIKRVIALGLLILLPIIVEFILGIFDIPGLTNKNPLCK